MHYYEIKSHLFLCAPKVGYKLFSYTNWFRDESTIIAELVFKMNMSLQHCFIKLKLFAYQNLQPSIYRILSAICAVPFAFCWGLYFAWMSFCYIWYLTPCVKAYLVQITFATKLMKVYLQSFCDPMFESCALLFSKLRTGGGSKGF